MYNLYNEVFLPHLLKQAVCRKNITYSARYDILLFVFMVLHGKLYYKLQYCYACF